MSPSERSRKESVNTQRIEADRLRRQLTEVTAVIQLATQLDEAIKRLEGFVMDLDVRLNEAKLPKKAKSITHFEIPLCRASPEPLVAAVADRTRQAEIVDARSKQMKHEMDNERFKREELQQTTYWFRERLIEGIGKRTGEAIRRGD